MKHETIHIHSPLPNTYAIITTTDGPTASDNIGNTSWKVRPQRLTALHPREKLTRSFELLLSSLRGESLLAAMLAYGLGVRVSDLRGLRVRDVCLKDRSIFIMGRYRNLPEIAINDLREQIHDRICGREVLVVGSDGSPDGMWCRAELLFSAAAFNALLEVACVANKQAGITMQDVSFNRRFDSAFKTLGRLHRRCAAKFGITCASPLELFDKGPRIVRRGRGGTIDAYYVWRAARELF